MARHQRRNLMELIRRLSVAAVLWPAFFAYADVGNVRVLGTTATQALIAYTAPDGKACFLTVSASPSYTPLAADVDPASFAGANSDTRPDNVVVGRARIFVVGKQAVQGSRTGGPVSRALE